MDRISLGLEAQHKFTIKATIQLLNQVMTEYSKDGTNKRINISNFSEEEDPTCPEPAKKEDSQDEQQESPSKSREAEEPAITEKEREFVANLAGVLPLISSFLKPEADEDFKLPTAYGTAQSTFGAMRLEAVEFLRIAVEKFSA